MHPLSKTQIVQLKVNEAFTKVASKYADFADVFLPKLVAKLLEHEINDHAIKSVNNRQPPYGPIYNLGHVKLETLRAYIKNNLANSFIRPSKSPGRIPVLFDKKPNNSLRLCVDYLGLNKLIIKN